MAWFTVQYRDKSGAKAEAEFEAADRSALFEELSSQNISAISVNEGRMGKKKVRKAVAKKTSSTSLKYGKIVATSLFGIICLCAAFYILHRVDKNPNKSENRSDAKKKTLSHEVKDIKSKNESKSEEGPPKVLTASDRYLERAEAKLKTARDRAKTLGLPWGNRPPKVIEPRKVNRRFEYDSEEHIATLLEVEPGEMLLGEFEYGDDFIEDLTQALATKIPDTPDDDEYTRELKLSVQQAKKELYERHLAGEDIGAIMRESRAELQRLAVVKMDIESAMSDLFERSDELSAQDMKDFEEAANTILKNKGLPPMKMPGYWRKRIALKEASMKGNNNE